MRAIYNCYVPLRAEQGTSLLDAIANRVYAWSGRPDRPSGACDLGRLTYSRKMNRGRDQECATEAIHAEADGRLAWAYQFETQDAHDSELTWVATVAADCEQIQQNECRLAVTLSLADRSGRLRPVSRRATRPKIVPELLAEYSCTLGLSADASWLRDSDQEVEALLAQLSSKSRLHPLVLLSVDPWTEKPAVSPSKLANRLAGVAMVHALDKHAGMKLERRVSDRGIPMNGAVKIFWPGWRVSDSPQRHQLFTAWDIKEIERSVEDGFFGYALDLLARQTVQVAVPDAPSWRRVAALVAKQRLAAAQSAGDESELLAAYEEDNEKLTKDVERLEFTRLELEEEVSQLKKSLAQSEKTAASWRRAYDETRAGKDVDEADLPESPPESLREACDQVRSRNPDRITFKHNSQSDPDYPYEYPEQVVDALEWLVGDYYEWRTGELEGLTYKEMGLRLREACQWHYKTTQSTTTAGKYRNFYVTNFEGRELEILEHIGRGDTKRMGPKSIRMGFCWDEETQKVIVGFIGQHQKNDQS